MKTFVLLSCLLLAGCAAHNPTGQVEDNAKFLCVPHGGLKVSDITSYDLGTYSFSAVCNDGAHFFIREQVKPW